MGFDLKGMVQDRLQDTITMGVMFGAIAWLMVINAVLPQYTGSLGIIGYLFITVFGLVGVNLIVREHVNSYEFIEVLVRPENDRYNLFIESSTTRKISPGQRVTTLNLAFPVDYDGEKVRRIEIHHTGRWSERVRYSPGYCVYSGLSVPHPQTEIIEVSRMPRSHIMVDHDETVPIFILRSASLDQVKTGQVDMEKDLFTVADYSSRNETLKVQLAEAERRATEWHQRAVASEEIIEQQNSEIRGLMSEKSGIRELAYEYMLTIYQACGSIEKALAHLRGQSFTDRMLKYLLIGALGISAMVVLAMNPDMVTTLAANTLFMVTLLAVAIVGGIIFVYVRGRKAGIP